MKKAPQLQVKQKNNIVIAGLGVDSWRERAISEVRGLRDERGPTQLGIYTRQSRDPRVKPEDDKEEKKVLEDGRREKSPRMTKKKVPEDDKEERRPIKREPRGRKGQV